MTEQCCERDHDHDGNCDKHPAKRLMFRIIPERGAKPHPMTIPWSIAELAYSVYAGMYGRSQSLERLEERGGFHVSEMDQFLPDWREKASELTRVATLINKITLGNVVAHIGSGEPYFEAFIPCDTWVELEELLRGC